MMVSQKQYFTHSHGCVLNTVHWRFTVHFFFFCGYACEKEKLGICTSTCPDGERVSAASAELCQDADGIQWQKTKKGQDDMNWPRDAREWIWSSHTSSRTHTSKASEAYSGSKGVGVGEENTKNNPQSVLWDDKVKSNGFKEQLMFTFWSNTLPSSHLLSFSLPLCLSLSNTTHMHAHFLPLFHPLECTSFCWWLR